MSKKNMESTRELMGTREVTDYSIRTYRNEELVYFLIQPSNISVLSEESLSARIYGLMTVLKGITEIEMMCLNSRENFEDNKRYLKKRMEEETNPVVRKLLEKDANYLDRMQVQMATAREFLLIIRLREKKENESEQNRCAMACQGCGAVFLLFLKKAVDYFLKSIYC